jgi:hypothetical protein
MFQREWSAIVCECGLACVMWSLYCWDSIDYCMQQLWVLWCLTQCTMANVSDVSWCDWYDLYTRKLGRMCNPNAKENSTTRLTP